MKSCSVCKTAKPLADFWKDSSKADGLCRECKVCKHAYNEKYRLANLVKHNERGRKWNAANRASVAKRLREWRKANPEKSKASKLRHKLKDPERYKQQLRKQSLKKSFGISVEEYDSMFKSQGGVCKICNSLNGKRRLNVDHCHSTGKIRGLLCGNCNLGLGNFKDSPMVLAAAMAYLSGENL
jgi:hypothetical protein